MVFRPTKACGNPPPPPPPDPKARLRNQFASEAAEILSTVKSLFSEAVVLRAILNRELAKDGKSEFPEEPSLEDACRLICQYGALMEK